MIISRDITMVELIPVTTFRIVVWDRHSRLAAASRWPSIPSLRAFEEGVAVS